MATHGEKVVGRVEHTSQYGIKINGEWYNPHGRAKDYMEGAVTGAEVELTLTGHKNDFRFIKVLSSESQGGSEAQKTPQSAPTVTQGQYWEKKEKRDVERDVRVSRHGAINTAVSIIGPVKKEGAKAMYEYMMAATNLANLVLRYVNGDDQLQEDLIDYHSGQKNVNEQKIPEEDVQ